MRVVPLFFAILAAGSAMAEMDFVTDPAMCGLEDLDRYDIGMTFDGQGFWTVEYNCQLSSPIEMPNWTEFQTQIRAAYCEEPGLISPTVFVIRSTAAEPGVLYTYSEETVYGSEQEAAGKFFLCGS